MNRPDEEPTAAETSAILSCLRRLAEGDKSARDALFAFAHERLKNLARWYLARSPHIQRWEQSGDISQEAMIRLHRALGDVHPSTPREFFALASLQVRRVLADMARHHFGPQGAGTHHDSLPRDGILDELERGGQRTVLDSATVDLETYECVAALPPDLREVFDLHHFGGLPHADIALITGRSERTIKRRWRAAKALLARQLGLEDDEDADTHTDAGEGDTQDRSARGG